MMSNTMGNDIRRAPDVDVFTRRELAERAQNRMKFLKPSWFAAPVGTIWLAGGALAKEKPNDYDLFLPAGCAWPTPSNGAKALFKSKNAATYGVGEGNRVIQLCKYTADALPSLLTTFDFAHCQVGCELVAVGDEYRTSAEKVSYTKEWLASMAVGKTWFTGSDYPLSSMLRLMKFVKRGMFSGKEYMSEAIRILAAIAERGYDGYPDFKDQLDAVDLGLLPEDIDDCDFKELLALFNSLDRKVK